MSKYDQFLVYDPKQDKILVLQWDTSYNGIDSWLHRNDETRYRVEMRGYLKEARKKFVFLDTVPEHLHREGFGYL
jgi:hypothetical protein